MKSSQTTTDSRQIRSFLTEAALVDNAYNRLRKTSGLYACRAVPLLGRCVDLAYIQKGNIVTVEFKLNAWRRAIRQARDHRLGADLAFVCIPERKVSHQMREEFLRAGVGLLFYSKKGKWPFRIILDAPKSTETWSVARQRVFSYLHDGHLENNGK